MRSNLVEIQEFLQIALEALGRYKLRTSLSVLGVILGVAAVISMMSVSEGARQESLRQVEALGLDNLVARSHGASVVGGAPHGLTVADADRLTAVVPLVRAASPLIERFLRLSHADKSAMTRVVGVRTTFEPILRLAIARGRFLSSIDEKTSAAVCVLGASLARQLFGYRNPLADRVRLGHDYYEVIGVLGEEGVNPRSPGTLAWRDLNDLAIVPLPALAGRSLDVAPGQPADEIWLQVLDGTRAAELAAIVDHTLIWLHDNHRDFDIVIPRELLAQRYSVQRTFSVVVGSVAALALLVGGIGIMNIMLTSVVERTHEIGIRRTVGATRHNITLQFLIETSLMTLAGGVMGIILGIFVSFGITAYAGWNTRVSATGVSLAFIISLLVGLVFGLYPAIKAAELQPVDALRYE